MDTDDEVDNTKMTDANGEENIENVSVHSGELDNPLIQHDENAELFVALQNSVEETDFEETVNTGGKQDDNGNFESEETPITGKTNDLDATINDLDDDKLNNDVETSHEKIGDADVEIVTGTGRGSLEEKIVTDDMDSNENNKLETVVTYSSDKALTDKKTNTKEMALSDGKMDGRKIIVSNENPKKVEKDNANRKKVKGRSTENEQEVELKVHDLSQGFSSVNEKVFEINDKTKIDGIIQSESEDSLKDEEQFINPFKCVIKTSSLMLLDEYAKKGVIKKQLPVMTMNEVVAHNKPDDCWVIIFGVVRDLTPLIREYKAKKKYKLVKPIVAHAGKDISHWFNENTNDQTDFEETVNTGGKQDDNGNFESEETPITGKTNDLDATINDLDDDKLNNDVETSHEKIGDADVEIVTGTGRGSLEEKIVTDDMDSNENNKLETVVTYSSDKALTDKKTNTKEMALSDGKMDGRKIIVSNENPKKVEKDNANRKKVKGRSTENEQEVELKVHDLSQGFSSVNEKVFEINDKTKIDGIIQSESEDSLKDEEQFINPFKCVIKTSSLMLLDEYAKKGVIKKQLPVMTMNEVVAHNKPDDCWVIIFGVVRDLTPLIREYKAKKKYKLVKPIVAHAGKDISHWFNENTNDIQHFVHPITGVAVPYTPHGRIPDVGLQVPSSKWQPQIKKPWWQENEYVIGLMTKSTRPVKIINVLNRCEVLLHVCCEDTIYRIQERYLPFNKHARSYTWKYDRRVLDMNLTLDENGIKDERKTFSSIGLNELSYIPCLMLYFNDDLTEL